MSIKPTPRVISAEQARHYLLSQLGLRHTWRLRGAEGTRAVLQRLRCIQLDPLDPMGTNADLVVMARVDGVPRGALFDQLLPGHAFEHFAKERCLLPASAFPHYRDQAAVTPWWHLPERLKRLPKGVMEGVLEEVRARGPVTLKQLGDFGRVRPMDWNGWKGTSKAASMAMEVLWTRCQVVVCGRKGREKVFDIPARALPDQGLPVEEDFGHWGLLERVEAAGLLSRAGGPHWSMLGAVRTGPLPDALVAAGALEAIRIQGSSRLYLAPAGFLERSSPRDDGRLRILGPLDPLLWDRTLVQQVFGFEYIWEVYKPEAKRRWGWYVTPLLHRGQLVGRLEGRVQAHVLRIDGIWRETECSLDDDALDAALARHAALCGAERVARPIAQPNP